MDSKKAKEILANVKIIGIETQKNIQLQQVTDAIKFLLSK